MNSLSVIVGEKEKEEEEKERERERMIRKTVKDRNTK